ncbi:unnamed protein product [Cyprideis torosa]|uniref:Uncharacterized protein n=1 Tax=Cyprideis torosa TaxID=163714 RepID=A0A7R8WPI4_9CRUS|nr:unnamed protein product [Cyprideis torosa]CAG0905076.1 unnamed protein product [Cyprideis torosa]
MPSCNYEDIYAALPPEPSVQHVIPSSHSLPRLQPPVAVGLKTLPPPSYHPQAYPLQESKTQPYPLHESQTFPYLLQESKTQPTYHMPETKTYDSHHQRPTKQSYPLQESKTQSFLEYDKATTAYPLHESKTSPYPLQENCHSTTTTGGHNASRIKISANPAPMEPAQETRRQIVSRQSPEVVVIHSGSRGHTVFVRSGGGVTRSVSSVRHTSPPKTSHLENGRLSSPEFDAASLNSLNSESSSLNGMVFGRTTTRHDDSDTGRHHPLHPTSQLATPETQSSEPAQSTTRLSLVPSPACCHLDQSGIEVHSLLQNLDVLRQENTRLKCDKLDLLRKEVCYQREIKKLKER